MVLPARAIPGFDMHRNRDYNPVILSGFFSGPLGMVLLLQIKVL